MTEVLSLRRLREVAEGDLGAATDADDAVLIGVWDPRTVLRLVRIAALLRDAVHEMHSYGLLTNHPEETAPFPPTAGGQWKLCPNVFCREARAALEGVTE